MSPLLVRLASVLLLVVALLAAGCVSASRTLVHVPVERGEPGAISERSDDQALLRSIATVLVTTLGLPLTAPIRAYVYPSREAFERGLVAEARIDAALARDQAAFALGVGTPRGIFLRGDRLQTASLAARVGVMSHELTHLSQYELAGGRRSGSEQWVREGFAEWVKYRTIDALGIRAYAESRLAVAIAVRRATASGPLPELGALAKGRDWIAARRTAGSVATYGQAFLAVDRLVARTGPDAPVAYFRRFVASGDPGTNFAGAFGLSRDDFLAEFRTFLAALRDTGSERPLTPR